MLEIASPAPAGLTLDDQQDAGFGGPSRREAGMLPWPNLRRTVAVASLAMNKALVEALPPAAGIAAAALVGFIGANRYSPVFTETRDALLPVLIAVSLALAVAFRPRRRTPGDGPPPFGWAGSLRLLAFLAALASLGITTTAEARFQKIRAEVLAAPPEVLAKIGRHVMVGADQPAELKKLIQLRAVAGVFVSWKQARGKNVAKFAASIQELQDLQRAHGGSPLWIAADQEGGEVQRLSPPLKRLESLSALVRKHPIMAEREAAVRAFAREQGRQLASIGVNVNFAPVVDINHSAKRYRDGRTRLYWRTISDDAGVVAETSHWYCDSLAAEGVSCTRKHFPGLGNVFTDTHVREARLSTPLDALVASDWVPFEKSQRPDWVMLGHMRAEAIDPDHPASASRGVVEKLRGLGHTGIVVTDDFGMGAIQRSRLGAAGAAVAALNAGVDIILVSYDADLIYKVLHALIKAHESGRLDLAALEESEKRLAHARTNSDGMSTHPAGSVARGEGASGASSEERSRSGHPDVAGRAAAAATLAAPAVPAIGSGQADPGPAAAPDAGATAPGDAGAVPQAGKRDLGVATDGTKPVAEKGKAARKAVKIRPPRIVRVKAPARVMAKRPVVLKRPVKLRPRR